MKKSKKALLDSEVSWVERWLEWNDLWERWERSEEQQDGGGVGDALDLFLRTHQYKP